MAEEHWREFLHWGRLVAKADLEELEHSYKRALAGRLQEVRSRFLSRANGWEGEFAAELGSTNLLNWRNVDAIIEAAAVRPGALEAAVATLWEGPEVDARALAEFESPVREAVPSIAPGNVIALGALLLMARNSAAFPPFRPTPAEQWRQLVGGEKPANNAVARYEDLLSLTDELLRRAPAAGIELADRLEAQGLAWTALQTDFADIPLSDAEKRSLATFRGDTKFLAAPDEVEREFTSDEQAERVIATDRDTRKRTVAEIYVRRGQSQFRRSLLDAYNRRCAVTGSPTESVLEAAHIDPYRGDHTNAVENGMLLRADIHTLFDLFHFTVVVEAGKYIVRVGPSVTEAAYRTLDGQQLSVLPRRRSARPSTDPLSRHNAACDWLALT